MPEENSEPAIRPHVRVVKDDMLHSCDSCGTKQDLHEIRFPHKVLSICPRCFWEMKIQMRDLTTTRIKP